MVSLCIPGVFMFLLILLSGDMETNPGPLIAHQNEADCLSILHLNPRSIRYKLGYIKRNFLDFDVLCFTETHFTNDVMNEYIELEGFLLPHRKDNTAHTGGLLIYGSDKMFRKTKNRFRRSECKRHLG